MNTRIARKIAKNPVPSKRLTKRLDKLYPCYIDDRGHYMLPSFHNYYRVYKAWVIIRRKARKYKEKFKLL